MRLGLSCGERALTYKQSLQSQLDQFFHCASIASSCRSEIGKNACSSTGSPCSQQHGHKATPSSLPGAVVKANPELTTVSLLVRALARPRTAVCLPQALLLFSCTSLESC